MVDQKHPMDATQRGYVKITNLIQCSLNNQLGHTYEWIWDGGVNWEEPREKGLHVIKMQ